MNNVYLYVALGFSIMVLITLHFNLKNLKVNTDEFIFGTIFWSVVLCVYLFVMLRKSIKLVLK